MPTEKERIERLGSVYLFEGLSDKELKAVAGRAKEIDHAQGKDIVTEDKSGVGFHLILEGEGQVLVHGETKGRLGAGDYFGEVSMIDGGPRAATVRADTPMRTLSVPAWQFKPLLEQPEIARKLLLGMCKRLRESQEQDLKPI
ncbi:MAG: cyclic nucleotide-binding domain-containing protein [Actinobacteria bacterium]|nr:cyclic nucleotide-binding domain-containing protein [Actinomycetota bacterium]